MTESTEVSLRLLRVPTPVSSPGLEGQPSCVYECLYDQLVVPCCPYEYLCDQFVVRCLVMLCYLLSDLRDKHYHSCVHKNVRVINFRVVCCLLDTARVLLSQL